MRLTGLLRVSTAEQLNGFGLDMQRDSIKAWAKAHGHRIVNWASDEGVSGAADLERRLGLLQALSDIETHRTEGIVVARLDRLARDLVAQESILREVWRQKARVFSTSAGEDAYLDPEGADADPSRALVRQILGAVSAYERAMVRLRMEGGKQRKRELGGFVGGGVPFGYKVESSELVPSEGEHETLSRILELHAAGASSRAICAVLTEEGRSPRSGKAWHSAAIAKVCRRGVVTPAEAVRR